MRAGRFAGFKFRRQHPLGPYFLDFFCPAARLSIELDGLQHGLPEPQQRDVEREKYLSAQGIEELRVAAEARRCAADNLGSAASAHGLRANFAEGREQPFRAAGTGAGGRTGAPDPLLPVFTWLRRRWVDGGFSGPDFADWVRARRRKLKVEVLKRPAGATGFEVLPRRWVVERTFAWLVPHRRLVRDCERTETSVTAWIFVAMIRVMLRRLA